MQQQQQQQQQQKLPKSILRSQLLPQRSQQITSEDEKIDDVDSLDEDAKKAMILRRRRLFSHYRQYEQWRKRQFSYDSYYYRPLPTNNANRRRRMYRRQYSCVERSDGSNSRDSHDSKYFIPSDGYNSKRNSVNSFEGSENVPLQTQASLQSQNRHFHLLQEEPSTTISERCTRSRINSAIFVSSEGRGFDSIEFLRRHGSQSVLCRKARSAENITDDDRKRKFSDNRQWYTEDSNQQQQQQLIETIELAECHQPTHRNSSPNTNLSHNLNPNQHINHTIGTGGIVAVVSAETTHHKAPTIVTTTHLATVTTANTVVGSISIEAPPPHIQRELLQQQRQQQQLLQQQQLPLCDQETNSDTLVRQKSSTSTSSPPQQSPNTSPKMLSLRNIRPKVTTLPTLSISGPSPPHEEQFL